MNCFKKNPNATEDEIISAKGDLANILAHDSEGYSEARKLREEIVEYFKAKYPDDETHEDILRAMYDLAWLLEPNIFSLWWSEPDICACNAALNVRQEIYRRLVQKNADAKDILEVMERIAKMYRYSDNHSEQLKWRKDILNFCRKNFVEDAPEVIDAMDKLSSVYESLQDYDAAENLRREIAAIKKDKHGDESNSDVISAKKQIADHLRDAGKYDEELLILQEIVELYRKNREENGGDRYQIASALDDVAGLLEKLGRDDEAWAIRLEIVDEYKKDYAEIVANGINEYTGDAIYTLERIADALNRIDAYEEELTYRKKIVELYKANEEPSKYNTVRALNNLADLYSKMDNDAEEFKLRRDMVEIYKKQLEDKRANFDEYKEIINLMQNLYNTEKYLENVEEMAHWEEEILATRRRIAEKLGNELGRTDLVTIVALENLAYELDNFRRYDEELAVRRDILARLQEKYPDEVNEEIFSAKCSLANFFYLEDNLREYLIECQEIAELQTQIDDDVDLVADKLDDVANVLEYIGNLDGAVTEREKILALLKEKYPANHEEIIDAEEKLDDLRDKLNAENIENVEDVEVADNENYLDESEIKRRQEEIISYREIFGNEHSRTLKLRDDLAIGLEKISRADEAAKLREENLTAYEKIMNRRVERFGESHRNTLKAMIGYAKALHKLKRYDDAEKIIRRMYEIYSEKYRDEKTHRYIITALKNLVRALEVKGDLDAAIVEQNKLVGLLKEKFAGYEFCQDVIDAQKKLEDLHVAKKNFDAEIISMSLRKGQKYDLTKNHPQLSNLTINFSWDAANNFEIDHSAFLLGANGKLKVDEDFIFYNNPRHESGGVEYIEKPAQIKVDLAKIPDDVIKIALTLTIYDADVKAQNFSQVANAYISIVDAQIGKEILRFDLQENFSVETAIVAGEIYRYKGEWKFNAVGAGFIGGLERLCEKFSNSV